MDKLRNLKVLIYLFEQISGLFINFHKSSAIRLGVDANHQLKVASMFNIKVYSFPIVYLGIPLRVGKLKRSDWQPCIGKVEKNYFWWGFSLFRAGKLIFIFLQFYFLI